jgi:hypothetical protein
VFNWLRKGPSPHHTTLAMIGAKTGDRVWFVGGRHPDLVAELALTTGLNGEVLVRAPASDHPALEAAATRAGALLALEDDSEAGASREAADLAVWAGDLGHLPADALAAGVAALVDAVRPGGRILLLDEAPAGRLGGSGPGLSDAAGCGALTAAGAVGVRLLASAGRWSYFEARRPR